MDFSLLPSLQSALDPPSPEGYQHVLLAWEGVSEEHSRAVVQADYTAICQEYDVIHMRRELEVESRTDFMLKKIRHLASMRFTIRSKQREAA